MYKLVTDEDLLKAQKKAQETLTEVKNHIEFATGKVAGGALSTLGAIGRCLKQAGSVLADLHDGQLRHCWALDAGSQTVRLCQLQKRDDPAGYAIGSYLESKVIVDPRWSDEDKRRARVTALRDLRNQTGLDSVNVVCALPGNSIFARVRTAPPVSESQLPQIVRWEIQQQIPFALDEIRLDYDILSHTEGGSYEVLMAAVKQDVADKYLSVLQEAGYRVRLLAVKPIAAYNWLKYCAWPQIVDDGLATALINLGARRTDIVIERGGQFRFTRPINLGGNDLTSAICEQIPELNFQQAEDVKIKEGMAPPAISPSKVTEAIGSVLDKLAEEIKRSFNYFRSQLGGSEVSQIILIGGGANLLHIVPYLEDKLGVGVRVANILVPLGPTAIAHPNELSTVLGLALECHQDTAVKIDLLS
jgi:type IV pilus assembly protein PilM